MDRMEEIQKSYLNIDWEKTFPILLEVFGSCLVITDCCHGLIFSVLTSTPCIVYKSPDHEISEGIKWFSHLNWVHYSPDEEAVPGLIKYYIISHPSRFTEEMLHIYRNI